MYLANLDASSTEKSLGQMTLGALVRMMTKALSMKPDDMLSEGIFSMWMRDDATRKAWRNLYFETTLTAPERQRPGETTVPGPLERIAVSTLYQQLCDAKCDLLPDSAEEADHHHELLTGVYYCPIAPNLKPLVGVLNVRGGQVFMTFVHKTIDYQSAQNAVFMSSYLFYNVVRSLQALSPARDLLLDTGAAMWLTKGADALPRPTGKSRLVRFVRNANGHHEAVTGMRAWQTSGLAQVLVEEVRHVRAVNCATGHDAGEHTSFFFTKD